jgi:hypothetical protein
VAGDEGHHVVFERDEIVGLHSLLIVSETGVRRTRIWVGFGEVFPGGERGKDVTLRGIVERKTDDFF